MTSDSISFGDWGPNQNSIKESTQTPLTALQTPSYCSQMVSFLILTMMISFSDFLQAIDIVEMTSYLIKVGFQNWHAKVIKLAVDQIHKNFNDNVPDDDIKDWCIHGVRQ